jgi:small multidrug resistance pump
LELHYLALFMGIAIAAAGQLLLKTGSVRSGADVGVAQFIDPFTVLGLAAYGLAALLYIVAIKKIPISLAYPTAALSYAVVAVAAHFLWHEKFGLPQIAGIVLIWGGILLLYRV